jgi:hypothetical protein
MKELIRQILREETGRRIISIKYLGRKSLTEETKYEYIDDEILDRINRTFILQQNYANSVSPLLAEYFDKYYKKIEKSYFNILIDIHFAERNYRAETFPSDTDFVNPTITEGIDVVVYNINQIWKEIKTQKYGFADKLQLKTANGVNYVILVSLNTPGKLDKLPIYNIKLFNQMKGKGKKFNEKQIIKVYNPK